MKKGSRFLIVVLAAYSIILLTLEWNTSQEYIRNYFTDIEGKVFFYGINTTLSMSLFFAISLVFLITIFTLKDYANKKEFYFLISQVCLFFYLGMDDRFMFHEKELYKLGIDGDYILAMLAAAEFFALIFFGNLKSINRRNLIFLILAGIFAAIMFTVDLFFPSHLRLRLSSEDLAKTWSAFFFFIFALSNLVDRINVLKSAHTQK